MLFFIFWTISNKLDHCARQAQSTGVALCFLFMSHYFSTKHNIQMAKHILLSLKKLSCPLLMNEG